MVKKTPIDITSQKIQACSKAENKEAAFILNYILAHTPAHIYWKDRNGVYLGSNDKQAISLGLKSGNEIVGKTDMELPWGKGNAAVFRENDLEVMATGKMKTAEELAIYDRRDAVVLSQKVPLRNSFGEVIGVLGISVDITDRKKTEQLQKETTEQISRAVDVLSNCLAHELRTPLAIIGINADSMKLELKKLIGSDETEQKNKIETCVDNIKFAIKRSSNTIDMLLMRLRSILGGQINNLKFKPVSIKDCINDAMKEYPFYNNEQEAIVWDDKLNKDFTYIGSDLLTKHILFNLIKNSLRAIKEVDRGKIYITLKHDGNFNYLLFKDTGSGISTQILESLFEQFKGNGQDGSGLGLSFCKRTMKSYGGDITCDSKEGEYTEFTLSFPKV